MLHRNYCSSVPLRRRGRGEEKTQKSLEERRRKGKSEGWRRRQVEGEGVRKVINANKISN